MFLEKLSNASGISGFEDEVRQVIRDEITSHVDDIFTDSMGNLFAIKKGGSDKPKIMLAAHMDEVGLFVDFIEKNGAVRFKKVGGIDNRVLLSKRVCFGKDKKPGVIGTKPIHLQKPEERGKKVMSSDDMFIDVGASSKEEAEKAAQIGDSVVFATKCLQSDNILRGKAFDDRAGCGVLVELLKKDYPMPIHAVFTVQEELGLRGARIAAYAVNPDYAFALEGTPAGDVPSRPETRDVSPSTALGEGPAITIMDRSVISDKRLVNLLVETAKQFDLPYQFKRTVSGGTDSGAIHLTREGVPSVTVAVPVRHIHSPAGIMNISDFHHTVELMYRTLCQMTEMNRET